MRFSNAQSYAIDGRIDSTYWYVNGSLVSRDTTLEHDFGPGSNQVKLVVVDNHGLSDSTTTMVTRSYFREKLGGPLYSGVSVLGANVMYVVASGDAIYRMNQDAVTDYTLQVGGDIRSSSSIAADTTVYITSSDKNLYAFSRLGTPVWPPLPLGGELSVTPTVDMEAARLYLGVANRNFIAINRLAGNVAWSFFSDAPIEHSAVLTHDRRLVFSTARGTLYGLDLNALPDPVAPSWTIRLTDTISTSLAIDSQGDLYVGTRSGTVARVSMVRGSEATVVWQTNVGSEVTSSPVIDASGNLCIGTREGSLVALSIYDGKQKWVYPTGSSIRSTASVSPSGIVYFGNDAGILYALDSLGSLQWSYQDSSAIIAPTLYNDDLVYFATQAGHLTAIFDGEAATVGGNAAGSRKTIASREPIWGTFQGNSQRTGAQTLGSLVSVGLGGMSTPVSYHLSQNYPNPFNPTTNVDFQLPMAGSVKVSVVDVLGRELAVLVDKELTPGRHQVAWDATGMASGLYFYRMEAVSVDDPSKRFVDVKKMVLLR